METCLDSGTSLRFDGKQVHLNSIGRTCTNGTYSDADCSRHVYRGVGSDGKPWSSTVKWFGYKLLHVADT